MVESAFAVERRSRQAKLTSSLVSCILGTEVAHLCCPPQISNLYFADLDKMNYQTTCPAAGYTLQQMPRSSAYADSSSGPHIRLWHGCRRATSITGLGATSVWKASSGTASLTPIQRRSRLRTASEHSYAERSIIGPNLCSLSRCPLDAKSHVAKGKVSGLRQ